LEKYDVSKFDRPSVTVDIIIFTIKDEDLKILLIKRKKWPFENMWAIPGGFVQIKESLDDAALRELEEETGLKNVYLEQLYTFGDPDRDPRTRVIDVTYFALISSKNVELRATTDASDAKWFSVGDVPKLAFDHKKILDYAVERIRNKIEYTNIAFRLLPEKFTLTELQNVYETIIGKKLDKRNFRKKIKEMEMLKPLNETKMEGAHRPAQLFMFRKGSDSTVLKAQKKI